ncbi:MULTISPECIES: hypothetical protein [unclassified Streptomyces]|uniref:hypothetical protein n=1 Tax=unclassified Streptomyces TaxID=2593676 RepID=UPI000C273FBF|nr:hypothetical protein [Streptomyces sp. CB01373]PJM92063.1 hypothetical protein CG719_30025 [Streptomyces sp. CB01373]
MRTRLLIAGLLAAAAALTGCGRGGADSASVPDGWKTLNTKGVSLSYPAGPEGYVEQSAAERSKYNAAAAVREESGRTVSVITVQLDFTRADSAEQAAIAAEAGIRMGAKVEGEKDVKPAGTDRARRIDFSFDSTGEAGNPPKGTPVRGVILTGLDSADRTFAVRIDAARGVLSAADLRGIIDSVRVH